MLIKFAHIENGRVANISEADDSWLPPEGVVAAPADVAIGDLFDGSAFVRPASAVASVTPWQIRKALNATGLRAAVEAAVSGADQTTRDAWEFAQEFRRDNPLIGAVAAQLGKTAQEVDDLFALARSL